MSPRRAQTSARTTSRRCGADWPVVTGHNLTSCRLAGWHGIGAPYKVDQVHCSDRFLIAPPRHMLVGTHEHKLVRINCPGVGGVDVEDGKRDAALRRRFHDARDTSARIETDQSVVRSERIVERAAIAEPKVRSPACLLYTSDAADE